MRWNVLARASEVAVSICHAPWPPPTPLRDAGRVAGAEHDARASCWTVGAWFGVLVAVGLLALWATFMRPPAWDDDSRRDVEAFAAAVTEGVGQVQSITFGEKTVNFVRTVLVATVNVSPDDGRSRFPGGADGVLSRFELAGFAVGGNQSLAYCTRGTNPAWLTCPLTTQDGRSLSLAVTDGEFVFDVKPDWDLNAMTERLRAGTT